MGHTSDTVRSRTSASLAPKPVSDGKTPVEFQTPYFQKRLGGGDGWRRKRLLNFSGCLKGRCQRINCRSHGQIAGLNSSLGGLILGQCF